jgi:hypothetical protein
MISSHRGRRDRDEMAWRGVLRRTRKKEVAGSSTLVRGSGRVLIS